VDNLDRGKRGGVSMFVVRSGLIAGVILTIAAALNAPAAAQDLTAPDHCQWTSAVVGAPTLSCVGPDGRWIAADPPYDIDTHTVSRALAGEADAMLALGWFYLDGPGTPRDRAAGLGWIRKAADKGDLVALRDLGQIYRDGYAAPKDFAEAAHWFLIAANRGDAESMANLASLYENGTGLPQNFVEAARWDRAAADKGEVSAMVSLGGLYYQGRGVARDDVEAVRWFRLAADRGDFHGMQALAFMYSEGLGAPKDPVQVKRLRESAIGTLRWAQIPSTTDMQMSYPVEAAIVGIVGRVHYLCRLADDGSPHHCRLMSEDPPAYGFAKAGRSIVGKFRLAAGLPPGSEINVPIRFALAAPVESRHASDTCAAYAIALSNQQQLTGLPDWWARYWIALSKRYAIAEDGADTADRLASQVSQATQRLADGKERGFLGRVGLCHLRM
jgi:TPR repeat protein